MKTIYAKKALITIAGQEFVVDSLVINASPRVEIPYPEKQVTSGFFAPENDRPQPLRYEDDECFEDDDCEDNLGDCWD